MIVVQKYVLKILEQEQNQNYTRSYQISKLHSWFQSKTEKTLVKG